MTSTRSSTLATLAAALVLALTGCSEQDAQDAQDAVDQARDEVSTAVEDLDLPNVDWEKYGEDARRRLEQLGEQADCQGLKEELAKVEGNDTELTRYVKALIREVDC
jgi:hypothetical protein